MENYQTPQTMNQNPEEHSYNAWIYFFVFLVLGALIFLFIRTKNDDNQISNTEKEQIVNELKDIRTAGPEVELNNQQKTEIMNNLQEIRRQGNHAELTDEQKAQIVNQIN